MIYDNVLNHYKREIVKREIIDWVRNRWLAIHCQQKDEKGRPIFIRYMSGKPLVINKSDDVLKIFSRFKKLKPRTMYASINEYKVLHDPEDVYISENIRSTIPTWDIDNVLDDWKTTIIVGRVIGDILMKYGIDDSLFYIWSGRGLHIHIHPYAISKDLREKYGSLDLAYSIVEYIRGELFSRISDLKIHYNKATFKVENKIDITRVFTVPLTIHRELDIVTIALKYDDLDNFTLDWLNLHNFHHNPLWRKHYEGEADELALKAYQLLGGYPYRSIGSRRKTKPVDEMIRNWLEKYNESN